MLASSASAPSTSQVMAGVDSTDATATATGSFAAGTTATTTSIASGLSASTAYAVWVACQDDQSPDANAMATPQSTPATTTADATPPVFGVGFPRATGVTDTSMDLVGATDEAATVFFVVTPSGESEPTSAQVKAGTTSSGASATASGSFSTVGGDTTASASVASGLTNGATYV